MGKSGWVYWGVGVGGAGGGLQTLLGSSPNILARMARVHAFMASLHRRGHTRGYTVRSVAVIDDRRPFRSFVGTGERVKETCLFARATACPPPSGLAPPAAALSGALTC